MNRAPSLEVEVSEVTTVAERVKRFRLVPVSGAALPAFSPGAHVLVAAGEGGRMFRNAYSLMGSPSDPHSYQISVLRTEHSRGGSHYLHDCVKPGARLSIGYPVNLFPLDRMARKHLLVAGGIGITPFLPMMEELSRREAPFELHYSGRYSERAAYADDLVHAYGARVRFYRTGHGERLAMNAVLRDQPLGTHLYVCGPERLIEDVMRLAREAGWPSGHLHSERFLSGSEGKSFQVKLARAERTIPVNEHESLLEALEASGVEVPFLCRGGSCGQCETRVLGCDQALIHNDHYLSPEERSSQSKIMVCVSRAQGGNLILDL